jgi:hypothetical protein
MLLITLSLWNKTRIFIAHAEKAPGTVTEMLEVLDRTTSPRCTSRWWYHDAK